jgi:hypothetical protein
MPIITALRRLRQENLNFEIRLYSKTLSQKNATKT